MTVQPAFCGFFFALNLFQGPMRKFSLELPKYRLQLHMKLIKRRKPLVPEPLIPTVSHVNHKYRKGTLIGKVARHLSEHKSTKKVFAANLAAIIVASTFIPVASVKAANFKSTNDSVVIEPQNTLTTEKTIQLPLTTFKLNQGFSLFHPGVDLGAEVGDTVKPMKAGKVVEAGYTTDGYGNTILLDHGQGLTTRYAHLSKIFVKVGDEVDTNTTIGLVGVTGHTTGPHLHFEVRTFGLPQNPLGYIPTN